MLEDGEMISLQSFKEIIPNGKMSLRDYISDTPHPHKTEILQYLKAQKHATGIVAATIKMDAIDGVSRIGSIQHYEDGVYYWGTEVIYYFNRYNLQLPDDFISRVLDADK